MAALPSKSTVPEEVCLSFHSSDFPEVGRFPLHGNSKLRDRGLDSWTVCEADDEEEWTICRSASDAKEPAQSTRTSYAAKAAAATPSTAASEQGLHQNVEPGGLHQNVEPGGRWVHRPPRMGSFQDADDNDSCLGLKDLRNARNKSSKR